MTDLIYINGFWTDEQDAKISVLDHGLLYGDGIYEGIRIYKQQIFKYHEHFERLQRSARGIGLVLPISGHDLERLIGEGLEKTGLLNAYVRVVITRGTGPIGPDPTPCSEPGLILIIKDIPPLHGDDNPTLKTAISTMRRVAVDSNTAEIKSLNYLPSVLGKAEAARLGVDDVVMLDSQGFLSEAPVANIFVRVGDRILTPSVTNGILPGITRQFVIELLHSLGQSVEVGNITPIQLLNADEAFLTGTHAEIVPISEHNGQLLGDGVPGPVFKMVKAAFDESVSR